MTLLVLNALLVFPLFLDRPRVSLAVESHDGIFFISGFSFFVLLFCFRKPFADAISTAFQRHVTSLGRAGEV